MNDVLDEKRSVRHELICEDQAGQRIDNFLLARLKGVPKSYIYRIVRKGEVRVNKKRIKPEYKLCAGDNVRIPPVRVSQKPEPAKPGQGLVTLLDASIVYESDELLVVNKPPGLAVHGGSGVNLGLIESLRAMRPEARFLELIHRLDRGTSGCVMVAKKRSMLRYMQAALREKSIKSDLGGVTKVYQALVKGQWPNKVKRVNVPLLRQENRAGDRIVKVSDQGKPSLTLFKVLKNYSDCSLVEAKPVTGRTHQIRVHAQFRGHALVGDDKYGDDVFNRSMREKGFKRLCLHAAGLSFVLPSGERVEVEAPLPEDIQLGLDQLSSN